MKRSGAFAHSLLQRQLAIALRDPIGPWLLGLALLVVGGGFVVAYVRAVEIYQANELLPVGQQIHVSFHRIVSILIALFVPLIGVYTMIQERESETLDLILTTPIQSKYWILSKMTVSMGAVILGLLGTIPMVYLTLIMGGVSPGELMLGMVQHVVHILLAVSIGLWAGAKSQTVVRGATAAYMLLVFVTIVEFLLHWVCMVGVVVWYRSGWMPNFRTNQPNPFFEHLQIVITCLQWGWVALVCWILYVRIPFYLYHEPRVIRPRSWRPIRLSGRDSQLWSFLGIQPYGQFLPDRGNPMYAVERQRFLMQVVRRAIDAPSLLWLISAFPGCLFFAFWPKVMLYLILIVIALCTPIVGANSFSTERQRGTWDLLNTTLLDNRRILNAKLCLTVGQAWIHTVALFIPGLLVLGMLGYSVDMEKITSTIFFNPALIWPLVGQYILWIPIFASSAVFLSVISTWFSLHLRKSYMAAMVSYTIALIFLIGPVLLGALHPDSGTAIGGTRPNDTLSYSIASLHAPYLFNLWPDADPFNMQSSLRFFAEVVQPAFYKLYAAHLSLLLMISAILYGKCRRWVRRVQM